MKTLGHKLCLGAFLFLSLLKYMYISWLIIKVPYMHLRVILKISIAELRSVLNQYGTPVLPK